MQEVKVKSNELGVAIYMENEADILAIAESEFLYRKWNFSFSSEY